MPPVAPGPAVSWKRNLVVLWVVQVVSTLGFSFTFPFFPTFFQELGITEAERAAFWTGVSAWVLGLGMALLSPLWGIIGDRYGRKLNVVRAMGLGAVILVLAGYSQTPTQLLISRFFVGATTGVMPAIMALAAAHTPRERLAFASGAIQSALFFGTAVGPVLGGIVYDTWGMRAAFWATGIGLAVGALLTAALAREDFRRPEVPLRNPFQPFADLWRMATGHAFLPLLLVILLVHGSTLVQQPAIPGITEELIGRSASGTAVGTVFMAIGVASSASSLLLGVLASRMGLRTVFLLASAITAALNLVPYLAQSLSLFVVAVSLVSLTGGGLAGVASGMVALRAPRGQHGAAFGASQAAVSFGIALGPLVGGAAAVGFGLRSVYLVSLLIFLAMAVLAAVLLQRGGEEPESETPRVAGAG